MEVFRGRLRPQERCPSAGSGPPEAESSVLDSQPIATRVTVSRDLAAGVPYLERIVKARPALKLTRTVHAAARDATFEGKGTQGRRLTQTLISHDPQPHDLVDALRYSSH
jgi:hypothetical protein